MMIPSVAALDKSHRRLEQIKIRKIQNAMTCRISRNEIDSLERASERLKILVLQF